MNKRKSVYKTPKQVRENEEETGFSPSLYGQKTLNGILVKNTKAMKVKKKARWRENHSFLW